MFYIKKSEGVNFAKLSGDNNTIHFDKIAGHNSIFGHNIAHGVLVILKFLEKIKITENFSSIKIQFQRGFKYNLKIYFLPHDTGGATSAPTAVCREAPIPFSKPCVSAHRGSSAAL